MNICKTCDKKGKCPDLNRVKNSIWFTPEKFKPCQMDLDALESMRTRRYGFSKHGEECIVVEMRESDYLVGRPKGYHGTLIFETTEFSYKKPVEIPPKGEIVKRKGDNYLFISEGGLEKDGWLVGRDPTDGQQAVVKEWHRINGHPKKIGRADV